MARWDYPCPAGGPSRAAHAGLRHHGAVEDLVELVGGGRRAGAVRRRPLHRVGHPRLPRPDAARPARRRPMTYQVFTGDPAARRRYWARSHLGWRRHRPGRAQRRAPGGRRAAAGRPARPASSPRTSTGCTRPPAPATSSSCTATSTGSSAWTAAAVRREPSSTRGCARPTPAWRARVPAVNPDGDVDAAPTPSSTAFRIGRLRRLRRGAQARRRVLRRDGARPTGWPAASPWSSGRARCWSSARR